MARVTHGQATEARPFERGDMLRRLRNETFDIVVVGGGITGVGVALDAASRGLRTALVERDDFASGTSSKSSKLVHGGLRYLQQGEVRLVYEALHERQRLRKNAPHLVHVLPFLIPILGKADQGQSGAGTKSVVSRKIARAMGSAMWMYDLTGGWRIGKLHRRLRKASAFAHMPTMPRARLLSAYLYYDAAVDDARLVVTIARTAAAHGAVVANGCEVVGFVRQGDSSRVAGVTVRADGDDFEVRARVVVNAAGVWSDDVRALDEGSNPDSIRPAKGVHLTVPWHKVRNDIAVVIPVPKDKRSLFVVPWGRNADGTFQHTYVGTTDTDYSGPLDDPQCTSDDIAYVLRALNASIDPAVGGVVTVDDVTGVWAGLRPLVKRADSGRTADLSRRHSVTRNEHDVITVTGGKLTTYRQMAQDTVDEALGLLGKRARCRTKRLMLIGADGHRDGVPGTVDAHLRSRHGTGAASVQQLIAADPTLGDALVEGLPYLRAEAVHAVRHEMARSLDDVLSRRTRARLFDRAATSAAAEAVAQLIAPELGWDDALAAAQVAQFRAALAAEHDAGTVTEADFIAQVTGVDR
jgi:glycerol-3-phosphate dehydrogenase